MVCYDLEFPEWARLAALDGADLIAAPVNWPAYRWPAGERPAEVIKAQAAAAANGVFVAVADRCRTERGVSWISGSLIAGPGRLPAGRAGPRRPPRGAHRRLRPAAGQGQAACPGDNDLLADRRPELYAWAPDKRVAAADRALGGALRRERHQLPRLPGHHGPHHAAGTTGAANGAAPRKHYEQLAEARRSGRAGRSPRGRRGGGPRCAGTGASSSSPTTRTSSGRRTSAPWPASAAAPARSARRRAGPDPLRGHHAGRVPAGPRRRPRPPVVIMIPGLDSVKEELQATAEYLLSRGLAVIAIDGPGQGEAEYELPIEPAYERVTAAVADYLKGRDDIDPDRIGRLRGEPGRLLRGPVGRLRAAAAGRGGAGRPVPVGPGLGHAARRRPGPPSSTARAPPARPRPASGPRP